MKPILLLGACLFATGAARAGDTFRLYQNARFGTMVRYPANLVAPQSESANGAGRKFLSRDRQIELTIYAFRNTANRSARGEMNRAIRDWKRDTARLTYAKSSSSWFVLSGYLGADIFYEKTRLQNGVFHTLIWQYPQGLKKRLDASVARSTASFSVAKTAAPKPVSRAQPKASSRPTPTPQSLPKVRRLPTMRPTPRVTTGGY